MVLDRRLFDNIIVVKLLYPDADRWNYEVLPNIVALIEEYQGDISLEHIGFLDEWETWLRKT